MSGIQLIFLTLLTSFNACSYSQTSEIPKSSLDRVEILQSINSEDYQKHLNYFLDQEIAYGHFSGVAMIQHKGKIIYSKASPTLPQGINTRFDIGSISKQFTAAAILQLLNEKQFKLTDPINNHLSEYGSKKWENVTIHHLLTHTSGIPSIYQTEQGIEIFFPQEKEISLSNLINKFQDAKLLFSPGEEFSYSNSGYVLLAAIVENLSGSSFQSYVENELFAKYGLKNTSFTRDKSSAIPMYGYREDLLKKAPIYHYSWMIGGGAIYSNATDLLRWTELIQSDDFLTAELRSKYLQSHTNSGYGYGWITDEMGRIRHDGGTFGFMSLLAFDQESRVSTIVLSNRSFENIKDFSKSTDYVKQIVEKIWKCLQGKEIEILPSITTSSIQKEIYANEGDSLFIVPINDSLYKIRYSNAQVSRVIPNTPLSEKDSINKKFIKVAKMLEESNFWEIAKYSDKEMKLVCYSGLMRYGMKQMKKQTGEVHSIVPYKIDKSHGLMRMKGKNGILDLIVYFNEDGKIQGIFEHGFYKHDKEMPQLAYPTSKNSLFVDGFPYAEESCKIEIRNGVAIIKQLGRELSMKKCNN